MSARLESRVKRLQWRRTPHSAAELKKQALRALDTSPKCMPSWVDAADLVPFYVEALRRTRDEGVAHEVDHYYPLLGETVCGLHVPQNVRVVTAAENLAKGNRLPPGDETWPPFDMPRPPRKNSRRPTNQPYHVMFPASLVRRTKQRDPA